MHGHSPFQLGAVVVINDVTFSLDGHWTPNKRGRGKLVVDVMTCTLDTQKERVVLVVGGRVMTGTYNVLFESVSDGVMSHFLLQLLLGPRVLCHNTMLLSRQISAFSQMPVNTFLLLTVINYSNGSGRITQ